MRWFEGVLSMSRQLRRLRPQLLSAAVLSGLGAFGSAQAGGPSFELYGSAQGDYIQDFQRVDPSWAEP